jgi:hypothetical protein
MENLTSNSTKTTFFDILLSRGDPYIYHNTIFHKQHVNTD